MTDNIYYLPGSPEHERKTGATFSGAIAGAGETHIEPAEQDAGVMPFPEPAGPEKLVGAGHVVKQYGTALIKGLVERRDRLYTRPTYYFDGRLHDERNSRIAPVRAKSRFSGTRMTPGTYSFHFDKDVNHRYVSKRRIAVTTAIMALGLNTAMAPFLDGDQFTVKDLYQDTYSAVEHLVHHN